MRHIYLVAGFCICAAPASAIITVNCNGGAADFPSISAAVASLKTLPVSGNAVIDVTGSCTENIVIDNFAELTINGQSGAMISAATGNATIRIDHSNKIIVRGFTIRGGNPAVLVRRSSGVVIDSSYVGNPATKGAGSGIRFEEKSLGFVVNTSVNNFTSAGVAAIHGSIVTIQATVPVTISNTIAAGFASNLSSLTVSGKVTIENNVGNGLSAGLHSTMFVTNCAPGDLVIRGNQYGVSSVDSSFTMNCPGVIENNLYYGVFQGFSGTASLFGGVIRNNGSSAIGVQGGGVAAGGTNFQIYGTQIVNNTGAGILLFHGSNGYLSDLTVQGNSTDGIQVTQRSSVELFGTNTVTGHPGVDLLCNTDSGAFGSKTGIGKMSCPGFNSSNGPKPYVPPII